MAIHAQTGIKLATKPAMTSLLGGHFIYKVNNTPDAPTPSSANVVENVNDNPTQWRHNVHIGSNGIKLRYGETTLSKWDTSSLIFYKPATSNGVTTVTKGIELDSTNGLVLYKNGTNKGLQLSSAGLEIFGSSQSTADVTVNSGGIKFVKGGLEAGTKNTSDYIYLWSNDDSTNHTITIGSSSNKSDWRIVAGTNFGVDKAGNLYASNANITGAINATSGTIGAANATNKIQIGTNTTNASIYYGMSSLASTSNGFYIGTDGISIGGGKFKVTDTGAITATGLTITGYATTQDNEDAKKVATDFLEKSGSSITLKTGWSSDYMTMTGDGTRIYCNSKALAAFTTSGATIQSQDEKNVAALDSNGLKIYQNISSTKTLVASFGSTAQIGSSNSQHITLDSNGMKVYSTSESTSGSLLAQFGSTVQVGNTNSGGYVTIDSTNGINLQAPSASDSTPMLKFNGQQLFAIRRFDFTNKVALSTSSRYWHVDYYLQQTTDLGTNERLLGVAGWNIDSSYAGEVSIYECFISLSSSPRIRFSVRLNTSTTIAVGSMKMMVYALIVPKGAGYESGTRDKGQQGTSTN